MDEDVYSFALTNALNEIQNACPEVFNAFLYREDGEVVAKNENTQEKTVVQVIDAFDGILEKANVLDGIEGIKLECAKGRVNVSRISNLYLVTVTSREADMKYVNALTRVLIPTVLKLLEQVTPAPFQNKKPTNVPEPEPESLAAETEIPEKEEKGKEAYPHRTRKETFEPEIHSEQFLSEPPVNQLIVENLGGLLVPSDTVRIDNEMLKQWQELYPERKVEEVEIETFDGKAVQCKVKPMNDSKYEGKGIIRIPEKIQLQLEIKKGELVRVKPVVT
ncbi:MAG: hypothetical protein QHH24_06920 [Candidatus Bathyarchaeota archaeon]|nr:hypothetical protein [Candidatus Bathyarchaeota archaeon]